MSEGLLGAVIGGGIALLGTGISLVSDYKKWAKDRRYNHLVRKRERMEVLFLKLSSGFPADLVKGRFSIDSATDVLHLCPPDVQSAYWTAVQDPERTPEKARSHHADLQKAMKAALADIDQQMDQSI
jgi:hypothetical protein